MFQIGNSWKINLNCAYIVTKKEVFKYLHSKYLSVHSTKPNFTILQLSSIIDPFSSNDFCSKRAIYNRFHY